MPQAAVAGPRCAIGALERDGDPLDEEGVDLRVGLLGLEEEDEARRVGDRLNARRERVEGREVGELRGPAVGMGGADEDVALAEPVPGAPRRIGDQAAGRGKEVGGDERQLAAAATNHHYRGLQARLDAGPDPVGAGPAAKRIAGRRRDVRAPDAGLKRRGVLGRRRVRGRRGVERDRHDADDPPEPHWRQPS